MSTPCHVPSDLSLSLGMENMFDLFSSLSSLSLSLSLSLFFLSFRYLGEWMYCYSLRALTAVKLNSYIAILGSPKYKNGPTAVKE